MGVNKELLLFSAIFALSALIALSTSHPATAALPPLIFPKDDEKIDSALNIQSTSTVINTRAEELPPYHFPKLYSQKKYTININKTDAKLPPLIFPRPKFNAKALDEKKEKQKLNSTSLDEKKKPGPKVAMEVTDLLKGGENVTVYEDNTETPMQNDTVTVEGPFVKDPGTTHEEEETAHSNYSSSVTNDTQLEMTASPSPISGENVTFTTEVAISNTSEALQEISNKTVTSDIANNTTSAPNIVNSTTVETSNVTTSTEANGALNETVVIHENTESKEKTADDNRTQKQTEESKVETSSSIPKTSTDSTTSASADSSSEESSEEHHEKPMAMASQQHSEHSHPAAGKSSAFLQPTESAAILAGVFVAVALLGYVGLLVWRRILEKRYGNREMLVNEEDFYDTNDLKNFEL